MEFVDNNSSSPKKTNCMKRTILLLSLVLLSVGSIVAQNLVSGIYIGGHIRRERPGASYIRPSQAP